MTLVTAAVHESTPAAEHRVLEYNPYIALGGSALYEQNLGRITDIEFDDGSVTVDAAASPFSHAEFPVVLLTSLGFTSQDIAYITRKQVGTIRSQIKHSLEIINETRLTPTSKKVGFARYCLESHVYALDQPRRNLRVSTAEYRLLEPLSYGESSNTIADKLGVKPSTVDTHIKNIAKRNGLYKRERIVLAAFMSRQVSL